LSLLKSKLHQYQSCSKSWFL